MPSLIELLAIRLSPQAGKSLVIPRRRKSSYSKMPLVQNHWIPACAGMTKQRGISLIELVMFIVIISIAVTGVLLVMNRVTGHSADTLIRKQALAIAESLLEEVELMPFTFCDPDDVNAASAVDATTCQILPVALDQNKGGAALTTSTPTTETRYSPTDPFDNVADYGGFSMPAGGIMDISGNAIGPTSGYSAGVTITRAGIALLGGADDGAALRITVTVTGPDNTPVVLEGYRTRYAPNDLP